MKYILRQQMHSGIRVKIHVHRTLLSAWLIWTLRWVNLLTLGCDLDLGQLCFPWWTFGTKLGEVMMRNSEAMTILNNLTGRNRWSMNRGADGHLVAKVIATSSSQSFNGFDKNRRRPARRELCGLCYSSTSWASDLDLWPPKDISIICFPMMVKTGTFTPHNNRNGLFSDGLCRTPKMALTLLPQKWHH